MIQSSNLVVEAGLPVRRGQVVTGVANELIIDRMSQVVVSLQQGQRRIAWSICANVRSRLGRSLPRLARFSGEGCDRQLRSSPFSKISSGARMFSKSLPERRPQDRHLAVRFRVLRWPGR